MLRIGTPPQAPPQEAPAQAGGPPPELLAALAAQGGEGAPQEDPATPAPKAPKYEINKVSPDVAGYKGTDAVCGNCEFFDGKGGCHIVDGDIDPTFHCNLFTALGGQQDQEPDEDDGSDASGQSPVPDGEQPDEQQLQ